METPLSAAPKEQDKGVSMVEDVLKTKSSTGPDRQPTTSRCAIP